MNRQNFWSGLIVVGFALLALYWIIPAYAGRAALAAMPPDLLPRIAAWIMLISGVVVVATAAAQMRRDGERFVAFGVDLRQTGWALWPFIYVAVCIYLMTMVKITYIGVPMIALMLFLLGERRWRLLIGYSVLPVILVYLLSAHLMRIGVV